MSKKSFLPSPTIFFHTSTQLLSYDILLPLDVDRTDSEFGCDAFPAPELSKVPSADGMMLLVILAELIWLTSALEFCFLLPFLTPLNACTGGTTR
mmetsp:Transcript_12659/g.29563  ORF Transcript_12659/g.29563 Transcript_12659/m.29563 type:complete len:95 (-) Transcript_12659:971-1255(-)